MYLASSLLVTLFQWSFTVVISAVLTDNSSSHWIKFLPAVIRMRFGSSFCGQWLRTMFEYVYFLPLSWVILLWFITITSMAFVPFFIVLSLPCAIPPNSFFESCLPYFSSWGVLYCLVVAGNCFTCDRMQNWICVVFEVCWPCGW